MKKEQWQELYDELYHIRHKFNKLYYDVFENTNISKKESKEKHQELTSLTSTVYNKIAHNQHALKVYEQGDKRVNDLKVPDHFEWNLTPFLIDLKEFIKAQ